MCKWTSVKTSSCQRMLFRLDDALAPSAPPYVSGKMGGEIYQTDCSSLHTRGMVFGPCYIKQLGVDGGVSILSLRTCDNLA